MVSLQRRLFKFGALCFKQIWKVGKIGKVGKVGKVGMVGKAGKMGKEGRLREELFPTLNQILQQSNKNGEKIKENQKMKPFWKKFDLDKDLELDPCHTSSK
jgi:hypothetical protein